MLPFREALKGWTDLPIALLALVFFVLLLRRNHRPGWPAVFLLTTVSGLFGAVVHIVDFSTPIQQAVWVLLYALLFETARRVAGVLLDYIGGSPGRDSLTVYIVEAVLYATAVIGLYRFPFNEILFLVCFVFFALGRVVLRCFGGTKVPVKAKWLAVTLVFPMLLQVSSPWLPFAVVWEHFILAATLFVGYRIACDSAVSDKKENVLI